MRQRLLVRGVVLCPSSCMNQRPQQQCVLPLCAAPGTPARFQAANWWQGWGLQEVHALRLACCEQYGSWAGAGDRQAPLS